jgi:predicted DsbA family dithiol-disulfide isomerase
MEIEVWSDVVCPWCYLGKRRLERAIGAFEHRDEVTVRWRSFELDPGAPPRRSGTAAEHLAAKYGMTPEQVEASWERLTGLADAEGLEYHLADAQGGSSFDAHRLLQLAGELGLQDTVKERLLRAYFTEGLPIGDRDVLGRVAVEAGLPQDEVDEVLATDRYAQAVRDDERRAQQLGIGGVPFFAVDGRYGVSGAQSAEHLLEALQTAWQTRDA